MEGLVNGTSLHVTEYPAAWRVEVISDGLYHGFKYLRWELDVTRTREWLTDTVYSFYWGPTQKTWDLDGGQKNNGTRGGTIIGTIGLQLTDSPQVMINDAYDITWQGWRLIPMKVERVFTPL